MNEKTGSVESVGMAMYVVRCQPLGGGRRLILFLLLRCGWVGCGQISNFKAMNNLYMDMHSMNGCSVHSTSNNQYISAYLDMQAIYPTEICRCLVAFHQ